MFCTNCGAQVSGAFCTACGAPAQQPAAPANVPPPPPAARKKTSPLVWVLVGIMVFFLLIGALVVAGGFFVYHKARQAGFDPDLLQRHPEVAAVKMMVAANPNAELVSVDEERGIVTVRDKETGKDITFNFEDLKHGRVSLSSGKDKVTLQGSGNSFEVKSSEGTLRLGTGPVKLPDWLPGYPGAAAEGTYSVEAKEGQAAAVHFTTSDSTQQVLDFYDSALKKAGLTTQTVKHDTGGVLTAEQDGGGRKASIVVTSDSGKTQIALSFESK